MPRVLVVLCASVVLASCGPGMEGPPVDADSGVADAGSGQVDAGSDVDAGSTPTTDAGSSDASVDAGVDGGSAADASIDAGLVDPDAGVGGERVFLRGVPCTRAAAAATRCEAYEVTCGGAAPANVDVAVFEPPMGVQRRGVIMFGSGGEGGGFYNFRARAQLLAQGFTLLERRWLATGGWFEGASEGPKQASCRLAALMRHFKRTLASTSLLCATGNSGGSAELTYALTWNQLGTTIDFALPTSGPFHQLDLGCQGGSNPTWVTECNALIQSRCPSCWAQNCQLGAGIQGLINASYAGAPRCSMPMGTDLQTLAAGSPVVGPDVATMGPVHFLIGVEDTGPFMPLATALVDRLADAGVNATMRYVSDAGHELDNSVAGANAITDELLTNCR